MKLFLSQIDDSYVQENFRKVEEFLRSNSPLFGFKHLEMSFDKATDHQKIAHGLGYTPKDIITSWSVGAGSLTFHYDLFDSSYIVVSTTDALELRVFVGTYQKVSGG